MPINAQGPQIRSYTPTLTNVANMAATTAYASSYVTFGDWVHVWGRFDLDPTAAGPTQTTMGISLPVASNLGAIADCGGTSNSPTTTQPGAIWGDITNDRAELNYTANNTGNAPHVFIFSYKVI